VPLLKLALPDNGKRIQSLFDFQALEPLEQQGLYAGISFNGGTFKGDSWSTIIEFVRIEARRIAVKIEGRSSVATSVFNAIANELRELNGGYELKEILCTHETSTSAVLDFPFDHVLSHEFVSFLESSKKYLKNPWSETIILPRNLKFSIRYKVTDDALFKSNITLASKELTIEPREYSSPDEKLYLIQSPTDTETHFKLIEELEKGIK
jgi:hypothetical protein